MPHRSGQRQLEDVRLHQQVVLPEDSLGNTTPDGERSLVFWRSRFRNDARRPSFATMSTFEATSRTGSSGKPTISIACFAPCAVTFDTCTCEWLVELRSWA